MISHSYIGSIQAHSENVIPFLIYAVSIRKFLMFEEGLDFVLRIMYQIVIYDQFKFIAHIVIEEVSFQIPFDEEIMQRAVTYAHIWFFVLFSIHFFELYIKEFATHFNRFNSKVPFPFKSQQRAYL